MEIINQIKSCRISQRNDFIPLKCSNGKMFDTDEHFFKKKFLIKEKTGRTLKLRKDY